MLKFQPIRARSVASGAERPLHSRLAARGGGTYSVGGLKRVDSERLLIKTNGSLRRVSCPFFPSIRIYFCALCPPFPRFQELCQSSRSARHVRSSRYQISEAGKLIGDAAGSLEDPLDTEPFQYAANLVYSG